MSGTKNTEQYVPQSVHELAGFLGSVVQSAAKDHPEDKALAAGVAAYEAWKTAQGWDAPAGTEQVTQ